MRKFKIALDADDVLYECNAYALKLLNEKKGTSYRISEIEKWGKMENELDERFDFFQDPLFYEEQPLMQGAKEFVKKLSQIAEVFIVTSVYPQFAGLRIQRLVDDFPWLEPSNILIASRKELVHVDMILDDGAHNVSVSIADYPVLFRQPWNSHVTGMLSVNTYEEFITLLQTVMNSTAYNEPYHGPKVLAFLGCSGAGKTTIVNYLEDNCPEKFQRVRSMTTRQRRIEDGEKEDAYYWTSRDVFESLKADGAFIESTCYGGQYYGTMIDEFRRIVNSGKHAIIALDACGCMAVKSIWGNRACIVYVNRSKEDCVLSVLGRKDMSNTEKARRILSLEREIRNADLADYVLDNTGTVEKAAVKLIGYLKD